jgi:PAS domain S-box-containing protein
VAATIVDLLFLAIAWEFLGKKRLRPPLWLRTAVTLFGVMVLDVVLFNTGAFAGTPAYLDIMRGTFFSRLLVFFVALLFLYPYVLRQNRKRNVAIEERPVLAILKEVEETSAELSIAQQEIRLRKEAEERLRESKRQLQVLLDNLPGMAYRCRNAVGWPMQFVSDGCFRLTGYTSEELSGETGIDFEEIVVPNDREAVRHRVLKDVASDRPFQLEYRIKRKDGEIRHVWEQGRTVKLSGDSENGLNEDWLEGFIMDITERTVAKEALIQALKEKNSLLHELQHRIKNNLSMITSLLDLDANKSDNPRVKEQFGKVKRRVRTLKYAFPGRRSGVISLMLRQTKAGLLLVVSDNGVGMPSRFESSGEESLGLQLVHLLADQLGCRVLVEHIDGTRITIEAEHG